MCHAVSLGDKPVQSALRTLIDLSRTMLSLPQCVRCCEKCAVPAECFSVCLLAVSI